MIESSSKTNQKKLMNNFTVYSKDGCPYCSKVVQVLQLAGLNHRVYKLDEDFDRESFYGQFGNGSTFPQVVIDLRLMVRCNSSFMIFLSIVRLGRQR